MNIEEMAIDDWEWYHISSDPVLEHEHNIQVLNLIRNAYLDGYKAGITRLVTGTPT